MKHHLIGGCRAPVTKYEKWQEFAMYTKPKVFARVSQLSGCWEEVTLWEVMQLHLVFQWRARVTQPLWCWLGRIDGKHS
jgi:hypothetical protein